eukprot:17343-Heterococcus_DN1.PRE.2
MADGEGRPRAAHIHYHADARQGQAAAAAAAAVALPSLLPAFSSPFQFLGLPRHDAAAPATMPLMVSYWPVGATPSTMRSTNSEACLLPLPLPIYMPGLFQPGGPSAAVAPAWGVQQHAHDSASAGMPQMAASASATASASASALASAWSLQQHAQGSAAAAPASALEQPDLMDSSSDDDSTSPAKSPAKKPKKRGRSAASLKGDSEAKEVRRERNRVHAKQSRWRKEERLRQLEQEVASHKQQLAAYRGAQAQQQGVVPMPDPALYQHVSTSTQIQASINQNDAQQAEHCLNTQWAVLDCFFKWLCSSASCTEQQWVSFAEQDCVLWLPVGSVEDTAATREAAQQRRTLVRFTGPAEILSHGRQHFLHAANGPHIATTATAAATGVGGTASTTATATNATPDAQLQVAIERKEMYKRCSDIMHRSSDAMYVAAPFLCKSAVTQGDSVVGVAVCKFVTDTTASNAQRLSGVNVLYDTCAMSRLPAATGIRYSARTTYSSAIVQTFNFYARRSAQYFNSML